MKLPRDISGQDLVKGLKRVGYEFSRQRGDHLSMTTKLNGEHHLTIPLHNPVKVGTLAAILDSAAEHLGIDRQSLIARMKL